MNKTQKIAREITEAAVKSGMEEGAELWKQMAMLGRASGLDDRDTRDLLIEFSAPAHIASKLVGWK